jgi:hypothetical protein
MRVSRERRSPKRVKECCRQHPSPFPLKLAARLSGAAASRAVAPIFLSQSNKGKGQAMVKSTRPLTTALLRN